MGTTEIVEGLEQVRAVGSDGPGEVETLCHCYVLPDLDIVENLGPEIGFVAIKNSAELFLSAMILDGVFERFPGLRGISMEHGAFWVPSWLKALDFTADSLKRVAPRKTLPSEVARQHLKFSPFAGEPVGWIIENAGAELVVFASDYPHPEGTADPIRKFEATMTECDQKTMDAFYYGNMAELMGLPS